MRSKETDPRRIAQRHKQIELGKGTPGYSAYTTIVPKPKRRANLAFSKHPITPDPTEKCSKRRFDGKLRVWRRGIHAFEEAVEEALHGTIIGAKDDGAPTAGPSSLSVPPTSKSRSAATGVADRVRAGASRACSNQHAPATGNTDHDPKKNKKDTGFKAASGKMKQFHDRDTHYHNEKHSARAKGDAYSVVVSSCLSPINEDAAATAAAAKRYTFNGVPRATSGTGAKKKAAYESGGAGGGGATAKFETPRKNITKKSALIRPGSSGKENFALSRSAMKRAAALHKVKEETLRVSSASASLAVETNPAFLAHGGVGTQLTYPAGVTSFEYGGGGGGAVAGGGANVTTGGGGLVCTGGVCMLPDARTGAFLPPHTGPGPGKNDGGRPSSNGERFALGEVCGNMAPPGLQQRRVFAKEGMRADVQKEEPQIPSDGGANQRRPLEEFLRLHATRGGAVGVGDGGSGVAHAVLGGGGDNLANVNAIGVAGSAHPDFSKSQPLPPKCARFNEGACDVDATRCEYRHAVWTFAERVEYEARRAFAENSRVLEQNSALLSRLREQDSLIADQSQEISALLDEVHRYRHAALRRRGTTAATPSRATTAAATIAATALRRTPLRSASSRASFRNTAAGAPLTLPLTPVEAALRRRRNSLAAFSDDAASASVIDSILSLYGGSAGIGGVSGTTDVAQRQRRVAAALNDATVPASYESIHAVSTAAGARIAKGPHGTGFENHATVA